MPVRSVRARLGAAFASAGAAVLFAGASFAAGTGDAGILTSSGRGMIIAPPAQGLSQQPYQEYKAVPCGGAGFCVINFTEVPAKSRLVISTASCFVDTSTNFLSLVQVLVVKKSGALLDAETLPLGYPSQTTDVQWSAQGPVSLFANAGQHMGAAALFAPPAPGTINVLACHVSGQLLALSK